MYYKALRYGAVVIALVACNCITGYRNIDYSNITTKNTKTLKRLSYRVFGSSGSPQAIEKVLRSDSYFDTSMAADTKQDKGVYVEVQIRQVNPPPLTVAWAYIAYCTLFILPSWDTQYGYDITYDTYIDGVKVKQHDYEIKRGTYAWILFLPVSWLTLTRPDEEEAFAYSAHRFLSENRDFLHSAKKP